MAESLALVDSFPISPLQKCHALNLQLRAHLSFTLGHYTVSQTWIKANLDNAVSQKVRKWLDLPPNATAHFLPLPHKWLGLDLILPSMLAEVCQLNTALALRHSRDPKMGQLYKQLGQRAPFRDLIESVSRVKATSSAKAIQLDRHLQHLQGLKIQSILFASLRSALTVSELEAWSKHITLITPSVSNFARKALLRCLPTNSNLHLWGKAPSGTCPNCPNIETENHVLNNCPVSAQQGRYTWRHNAVLKLLVTHIQAHLSPGDELFVDLPGFLCPDTLYTNILPDITVVRQAKAFILELTCCYERNLVSSKQYKIEKHNHPSDSCKRQLSFSVGTAEISSLGFIPTASLIRFCRDVAIPQFLPADLRRMGEMSLRCSFFIFCARHKTWPT